MRVLVSGSTGLIGSALVQQLRSEHHDVSTLTRGSAQRDDQIEWDPARGHIDANRLEGTEAVVHLAGENIASGRWTRARKERIHSSRVHGTRALCDALRQCDAKPRVFVGASAIGYYGNRGSEVMTEASAPADDFLARTCVEWEQAAQPLADDGCRVANMRIGVVISSRGGALKQMLPAFRRGVGGKLGRGDQFMSWIAIEDVVAILARAVVDERIDGPHNTTAPIPVTNAEFTKTLGRILSRPTLLSVPAFAIRLLFGEMGEELLLSSTRVQPQALQQLGYEFLFPDVESALRRALDRPI